MAKLEVIAFCKEDVDAITSSKADRIELVEELDKGGLTPTVCLIRYAQELTNKPIRVMIRPHDNGFCYDASTLDLMLEQIELVKSLGCEGVVFGVLTADNKVDVNAMKKLVEAAKPMKITFHRAIDDIKTVDLAHALLKIEKLGVDTILTSLGHIAEEKKERFNILKNSKIEIMYGSGLTVNNVSEIRNLYPLAYYHAGTGVRENNSIDGDIDLSKINAMVDNII